MNNMINVTIDNISVQVPEGVTLLSAARAAGIDIPTLCHLEGLAPSTSCMVCVVQVEGMNNLVPSCAFPARDGMIVHTKNERVIKARRTALELLLSEHLGDCEGPCRTVCPANMNIPLMIRQIRDGKLREAIVTVKEDIALPAVLGRICPAPCEKACRRAFHDQAVSICLLKRYVADADLQSTRPWRPEPAPDTGKTVAVIGGGPAGLSAAYYLARAGIRVRIFDRHEKPGGMLRYGIDDHHLDKAILDKEIETLFLPGIEYVPNTVIGSDITLDDLRSDYNSVFFAPGQHEIEQDLLAAFEMNGPRLKADPAAYRTSVEGIYAGGDVIRKRQLAIRSLADGKEAAAAIVRVLTGGDAQPPQTFNIRMGKLQPEELVRFVADVDDIPRIRPSDAFTDDQARAESRRCLHCDCRKPRDCRLRVLSAEYGASISRYKSPRRIFEIDYTHPSLIFEPGKCILCGLCVQITQSRRDIPGLTFTGRGFNARISVPFNKEIRRALDKSAEDCVRACPTGAIAWRD